MKFARRSFPLGGLPLTLTLTLALSGCFATAYLLHPEQRLLIKNLCKELESGSRELKESVDNDKWETVLRVSDDMGQKAHKMRAVEPTKDVSDFQTRALELEHDLSLISREAENKNGVALKSHVEELHLVCSSCHSKFRDGRPW